MNWCVSSNVPAILHWHHDDASKEALPQGLREGVFSRQKLFFFFLPKQQSKCLAVHHIMRNKGLFCQLICVKREP